jgi:hypothetical protein
MAGPNAATEDDDGSAQADLREQVRRALAEEGFNWELWQKPERGQEFGMIRQEGDMQLHVRYYEDDVIKAERELANDYVEHLVSPRFSAHEEVERLLAKHDLDEEVDVEEKRFPPRHDGVPMPDTRTRWKPLVLGAGVALVGAIAGRGLLPGGD